MKSKAKLYRFDQMPRETVGDGRLERTAIRGDNSIVTLNWVNPGQPTPKPHNHPFDQLSFVFEGTMVFEIDGEEIEAGPGTVLRIPPDAMHTAWVKGTEVVLNVDVFAPPRADYVYLTRYQDGDFDDKS